MESIKKLMLRIEGGETSEPIKTLLTVGDVPDDMRLAPSLISLEKSWRIVHAQMFTAYGMWSPATTTSGTMGHLQITLFVPPNQQLANSANPLDVLNGVIDLMGAKGNNSLRLPNTTLDALPFEKFLQKYPLEERAMPLPVMAGKTPATFCVSNEAQLRALMRFSRYPVLAKVSQLELGYHCATTININTKGGSQRAASNKTTGTPPPLHDTASPAHGDLMGGIALDTSNDQGAPPYDDPLFSMGVTPEQTQLPPQGEKPSASTSHPMDSQYASSASATVDSHNSSTTAFMGGRSLGDPPAIDNYDDGEGKKGKKGKKWLKRLLIILGVFLLLIILVEIFGSDVPEQNQSSGPATKAPSVEQVTEIATSAEETSEEAKPAEAQVDSALLAAEIMKKEEEKIRLEEEYQRLEKENKRLKEEKKKQDREAATKLLAKATPGKKKKADLVTILHNYDNVLSGKEKHELKKIILAYDDYGYFCDYLKNSYTWNQLSRVCEDIDIHIYSLINDDI